MSYDYPAMTAPAMTPQQREFAASALKSYKEVMVGDASWSMFVGFELYRFLFANMESVIGIGFRRLILPLFLETCGKAPVVGHGVTIRQPHRISFGKRVILDDYALVDVRTKTEMSSEAFVRIGDYVYVGRGSIVSAKYGQIILGAGVNMGSNCRIATQSKIEMGESVLIGSYVYVGPGNHGIGDLSKPVMEQEMDIRGGVTIGANTWIGTRATILDGVTIGRDVVIGAHSLVKEDVPDRAIVAGTPAKIIRYRE